ncbi:MAG: DUF3037 domain-containing protein [Eubacteriales bacterium]|nr:DUF3037 domain-containing protein [Eubacteriales bacterium]
MSKIQFSVLSYFPSALTDENINIGIIFHNLDTGERQFRAIKNWKRLVTFDDEVDIEFMKKYLKGMKSEVETSLFNYNKSFCLKEYTRYYVNDVRFGKVQEVTAFDEKEFIETTHKIYLRFDFPKKERVNTEKEIKYIKQLMHNNEIDFSSRPALGKYQEPISYDYRVGEYGFKTFTFENKKDAGRMIQSAKAWAYNAHALKDKYKTIFVYDVEKVDLKNYSTVIKILNEHAFKVIVSGEVIDFILSIN